MQASVSTTWWSAARRRRRSSRPACSRRRCRTARRPSRAAAGARSSAARPSAARARHPRRPPRSRTLLTSISLSNPTSTRRPSPLRHRSSRRPAWARRRSPLVSSPVRSCCSTCATPTSTTAATSSQVSHRRWDNVRVYPPEFGTSSNLATLTMRYVVARPTHVDTGILRFLFCFFVFVAYNYPMAMISRAFNSETKELVAYVRSRIQYCDVNAFYG